MKLRDDFVMKQTRFSAKASTLPKDPMVVKSGPIPVITILTERNKRTRSDAQISFTEKENKKHRNESDEMFRIPFELRFSLG